MLQQFATVFVFLCVAIFFVIISQVISFLLRPKNPFHAKQRPYECGEEPEGSPWVKFNIRFYLIALFFIIFDVEIVFMLPWAVVFQELLQTMGAIAFWEMAIFVSILVVGLAYVWSKGDLEWVKHLAERDVEDIRPLSQYSSGEKLRRPRVEAGDYV